MSISLAWSGGKALLAQLVVVDSLTATVLDSAGSVIERKDIPTKCRRRIADYFGSHGPDVQVAVESVGFYRSQM